MNEGMGIDITDIACINIPSETMKLWKICVMISGIVVSTFQSGVLDSVP
jgi:hypothetical protein